MTGNVSNSSAKTYRTAFPDRFLSRPIYSTKGRGGQPGRRLGERYDLQPGAFGVAPQPPAVEFTG